MKKKEILVFFLVLAISFIGAGFWYFCNLQKQISVFKKESSEFNTVQQNQIDDLVNLITFNWATYQNDKFGFSVKHPEYVYICENSYRGDSFVGVKLSLDIYIKETCEEAKNSEDAPTIKFSISDNKNNYKTSEDAFYKEFSTAGESLNTRLKYFKINKFDAYGGEIISAAKTNTWLNYSAEYGAVILKNNYIIKISDSYYNQIYDGRQMGDKDLFDTMISTFYFDAFRHWQDDIK